MYIKRIQVKNFKSFASLDLELNALNIFVGANASGKSNLISILDFLRNIAIHGLENAISLEGGIKGLKNFASGPSEHLEIAIEYMLVSDVNNGPIIISKVEYKFAIRSYKTGNKFRVVAESLNLYYQSSDENLYGTALFELNVVKSQIKTKANYPQTLAPHLDQRYDFVANLHGTPISPQSLLLETPYFQMLHNLRDSFSKIGIYNLEPKLSKQASSINGLKELSEDGSNLSFSLNSIVKDREQKRKFLNLLQNLLPFITDFQVKRFTDKSYLFQINEAYTSTSDYLLPSQISDGTVSIFTLLIALYFEQKMPVILEEPERNIHPHLIANLVNMFEDASANKQLIITTHNPEVVRYADLTNLFLVRRDASGCSIIQKPAEIEAVKIFLQNEIGIEELYIQNLIEVP